MRLWVTDPSEGSWIAEGRKVQKVTLSLRWPCAPCVSGDLAAVCCAQDRECLCLDRSTFAPLGCMPAMPGISMMRLSPCANYLYQLSSEADCLHTRRTTNGDLLYAFPVGVFPHSMALDPSGRLLLAAGGSVPHACLLSAPELKCEQVIQTRHACFAADFWHRGLVLVCAREGVDIHTEVCTFSGNAMRRIAVLSGQPGALVVCPDRMHALISTRDGMVKTNLMTGHIVWKMDDAPMCMRAECNGNIALLSDAVDGSVYLLDHHQPSSLRRVLTGTEAHACFC